VLVARRFAFFDFNLKAEALILAALASPTRQRKWRKRSSLFYQMSHSLTPIIQDHPRHRQAWRKAEITRDDYIACRRG
jgi:hypothetical protein